MGMSNLHSLHGRTSSNLEGARKTVRQRGHWTSVPKIGIVCLLLFLFRLQQRMILTCLDELGRDVFGGGHRFEQTLDHFGMLQSGHALDTQTLQELPRVLL